MKVLFHIDESEKWEMTLANARNMLNYGKSSDVKFVIEILANGVAVTQLRDQNSKEHGLYLIMKELSQEMVDIVACRNALNSNRIDEQELCSFVRIVPAGVVELAMKQNEGYSYIKP